ncbi:MAG: hypothetical protein ABS79_01485 [Planctomycetes bacterium SCN 63-9]|nr:MAG: hypothetical protein ABS79_01485 [Planctomycetes bacterium SCN 63-9]
MGELLSIHLEARGHQSAAEFFAPHACLIRRISRNFRLQRYLCHISQRSHPFQHIAQIKHQYQEMASAILGQCIHQAYFRTNDAEMARWCADQFGLLIRYNTEGFISENDPVATENNFLFLPEAHERTGFECIIRSSQELVTGGPRKIRVTPRKDLEAYNPKTLDPELRGFLKWKKEPTLEAWTKEEREFLKIPRDQKDAPAVPLFKKELFVNEMPF